VKKVFLVSFLVAIIAGISACSQTDGDAIRIGVAGPFTGELSKIGLDSLHAVEMAVKEFNEAGGVGGQMVEIEVGDDAGDPAKGNVVADKFVSDESIVGVIGPMNSHVVSATLPVYDKGGLVLISQSATTPELTEQGYRVMNRICPRDDAQGKAAASFIYHEVKPSKIYILDDKTTYGQGLADELEESIKTYGMTEIKRDQISTQDKDFSALISLMRDYAPEMVYMSFANPAQAANLARQMYNVGFTPYLMGGDGCREEDQLIGIGKEAVQGMYVTAIGRNIKEVPEAKEFVEKFEAEHQGLSIFSGQSYEATKILLNAIKKVAESGELTREKVLEAVRSTKEYLGILGFPISFDSKGDLIGGEIYVLKVDGDDFTEVKKYTTGNIK
jgi:branched-chain amino acid transport system substrate-binding protein